MTILCGSLYMRRPVGALYTSVYPAYKFQTMLASMSPPGPCSMMCTPARLSDLGPCDDETSGCPTLVSNHNHNHLLRTSYIQTSTECPSSAFPSHNISLIPWTTPNLHCLPASIRAAPQPQIYSKHAGRRLRCPRTSTTSRR
jgi:hypothetical protein